LVPATQKTEAEGSLRPGVQDQPGQHGVTSGEREGEKERGRDTERESERHREREQQNKSIESREKAR
jgi:hypothetical protein